MYVDLRYSNLCFSGALQQSFPDRVTIIVLNNPFDDIKQAQAYISKFILFRGEPRGQAFYLHVLDDSLLVVLAQIREGRRMSITEFLYDTIDGSRSSQ